MSDLGYEAEPVLGQLKDFQRASVEHAFHQLFDLGADRFLVADEVGLGKTMVARGVIAKAIERLWNDVGRIDVIYICSNAGIAKQNIRRLNVMPDQDFSFSSRMTMIARDVKQLEDNKVNFVSFTPGTSFDLKSPPLGWRRSFGPRRASPVPVRRRGRQLADLPAARRVGLGRC